MKLILGFAIDIVLVMGMLKCAALCFGLEYNWIFAFIFWVILFAYKIYWKVAYDKINEKEKNNND